MRRVAVDPREIHLGALPVTSAHSSTLERLLAEPAVRPSDRAAVDRVREQVAANGMARLNINRADHHVDSVTTWFSTNE